MPKILTKHPESIIINLIVSCRVRGKNERDAGGKNALETAACTTAHEQRCARMRYKNYNGLHAAPILHHRHMQWQTEPTPVLGNLIIIKWMLFHDYADEGVCARMCRRAPMANTHMLREFCSYNVTHVISMNRIANT